MAVTVTTATVWIGVGLLALLITTALLTVGRSVLAARRDRKHAAIRDRLKADLLATIGDGDDPPDWGDRDLSDTERTVMMELLHRHLRVLDGEVRDRLAAVALALHLDDRAFHRVRTGTPPQQRGALHFLTVLGAPIDPDDVLEACRRPMTSRVAATKTLLEQPDPDIDRLTAYLLEPGEPLSQRGMDVLLELCQSAPRHVLEYASQHYTDWEQPLLIQVLTVIGWGFPQAVDEPLAWIVDIALPDAGFIFQDTVEVRTAAIAALHPYGWRRDVRDHLSVRRLITDPAPRVRAAAYELLGAWGDDMAVETLAAALHDEGNDRSRLRGAVALHPHRPRLEPSSDALDRTWRWVRANHAATEAT